MSRSDKKGWLSGGLSVGAAVGILVFHFNVYASAGAFEPGEDGRLSEEILQKEYQDNEVGLLPEGYAWEARQRGDETFYCIVTAEEYAEGITGDFMESDDEGAGAWELSFDEPTIHYTGEPTREYLQKLLCRAAGKLPYSSGGRLYTGELYEVDGGVDNRKAAYYGATGYGVDSIGLLYWAYRSAFGYTTHDFSDPLALYQSSCHVVAEELLPGDIGLLSDQLGEMNRYGICIGYDGSVPVFAHMNTMPQVGYPGGVLELSELKAAGGGYFNGSAPVEFHYFMRLDLPWED